MSPSQLDRERKAKTRAMAFQSDAINCPCIPSASCVLVVSYGISIECDWVSLSNCDATF